MPSPPGETSVEQPHLVSLVLQSKKALQHGQQLCSKANILTNESAQHAVDVLALDAKIRWISEAVIEQLKVCAMIPELWKRANAHISRGSLLRVWQSALNLSVRNWTGVFVYVSSRIASDNIQSITILQEWDIVRSQRVTALDNILEALGAQLVPPDFHQTSTNSSLFGSQGSEDRPNGVIDPQLSPSATVRGNPIDRKSHLNNDRTKWKTLRDFADEAAVEEVLDAVESDRTRIDVSIWHFDCLEIRHWTTFRTS